jgi:Antitoxin FitA-like, ribbon-helix-helix
MQYTIRNIPPELDRALRQIAKQQDKSLNEVVIEAMQVGAGLGDDSIVRRDLSDVAGTWLRDVETDRALVEQRRIDTELWR